MRDIWYWRSGGATHGPLTTAELRVFIATGRLTPDVEVCREGSIEWEGVESFKARAEHLTAKPSALLGRVLRLLAILAGSLAIFGVVWIIVRSTIGASSAGESIPMLESGSKMEPVDAKLAGGMWIVGPDGSSAVLRGVAIALVPTHVIKSAVAKELLVFRANLDEKVSLYRSESIDSGQIAFYDKMLREAQEKNYPDDYILRIQQRREPHARNQERRDSAIRRLLDVANTFDREIAPLDHSAMLDVKELYQLLRYMNSRPDVTYIGTSEAGLDPSSWSVTGFELWTKITKECAIAHATTNIDGKYHIRVSKPIPCYLFASQKTTGLLVEWLVPVGQSEWASETLDLFNKNARHYVRK